MKKILIVSLICLLNCFLPARSQQLLNGPVHIRIQNVVSSETDPVRIAGLLDPKSEWTVYDLIFDLNRAPASVKRLIRKDPGRNGVPVPVRFKMLISSGSGSGGRTSIIDTVFASGPDYFDYAKTMVQVPLRARVERFGKNFESFVQDPDRLFVFEFWSTERENDLYFSWSVDLSQCRGRAAVKK